MKRETEKVQEPTAQGVSGTKQNASSGKSEKTNSNYSLDVFNEYVDEKGIKRIVGKVKGTDFIARSGPEGYEIALGNNIVTRKKYNSVKDIYQDVGNINWEIVCTIAAIVAEEVVKNSKHIQK